MKYSAGPTVQEDSCKYCGTPLTPENWVLNGDYVRKLCRKCWQKHKKKLRKRGERRQ